MVFMEDDSSKLLHLDEEAACQARLAQLVERKALNLVVVGLSPTVGNFIFGERCQELFQ